MQKHIGILSRQATRDSLSLGKFKILDSFFVLRGILVVSRDTYTCDVVADTPYKRVEATFRQRFGLPCSSRSLAVSLLANHSSSKGAP